MHPDAAALLGIDAEDCGGIGALPGATLQSITPWDLAVLELDEPVPLGWAATAFATDYHRLLEPDELPVRGDRVTLVGYGATAAFGPADPAEFGFRRWALTFILYTSFAGEPHFVTAIGEPHAFVGDSGGPVLWPGGAGVPNRLDPVIATSAFGVGGVTDPHADDGLSSASLVDPDNIAWVNSQLDLDGDGRFDASCGGLPGRGSNYPDTGGSPGTISRVHRRLPQTRLTRLASEVVRPASGGVKHVQDLEPLTAYAVGDDVWRSRDHELSRLGHAPGASHGGVLEQQVHSTHHPVNDDASCDRIVLADVGGLCLEARQRLLRPPSPHRVASVVARR